MIHFLHLLKSVVYTALIVGIPTMIVTGGTIPQSLFQNPAYQFLIILVFAYTAAPVISDFAGNHIGKSIFFPNRANLDHPTMSHILSLRNKRLYKEAQEELRMLTDLHPEELEPYKMLLHLSAHELPDRPLFDMVFRKGMTNIASKELREKLARYRDEHIQHKDDNDAEWCSGNHKENRHTTTQFFANSKHHREKRKHLVTPHTATLPPRSTKKKKQHNRKSAIVLHSAKDATHTSNPIHSYSGNEERQETSFKPTSFIFNHKQKKGHKF